MKKFLVVLIAALIFVGCSNDSNKTKNNEKEDDKVTESTEENNTNSEETSTDNEQDDFVFEEDDSGVPVALILFDDGNEVYISLNPSKAPNTVNNFISLANQGFYDGLMFHRIIEGFMIQGGDPEGNGTGGPGYSIVGEMANNGFEQNDLKNTKGTIAMARSQSYDSAGSQFFINTEDNSFLDNEYAVFGEVFEGYEIIEEYSKVQTNLSDEPVDDVIMTSVKIFNNGYEPKEPEINAE